MGIVTVILPPEEPIVYDIDISPGRPFDAIVKDFSREPKRRVAIITDENRFVAGYGRELGSKLREAGIDHRHFMFPEGEPSKCTDIAAELWEDMAKAHFNRKSRIVALGGGVVGDLAGFIAATYLRGIDYVQVPTTLLALVDSSVGGKVALDLRQGKNLVGAFYHPRKVHAGLELLQTLPENQFVAGMGEVIKYGVIYDAALFSQLEAQISQLNPKSSALNAALVERCCQIKADVVGEDPKEKGKRAILNFGHTPAHGLEKVSKYKLLHGEAVGTGMLIAGRVAMKYGFSRNDFDRLNNLVLASGLPAIVPSSYSDDDLVGAMEGDKKSEAGEIYFTLPQALGSMNSFGGKWKTPISRADIKEAISASR